MNVHVKDSIAQTKGESGESLYLIAAEFLSQIDGPILDLGSGRGLLLERLHKLGRKNLAGCDLSTHSSQIYNEISFHKADLNSTLPFAVGSFHAVSALELIEHLENPRFLLREIFRILKPGGVAFITTPNNESITSIVSLVFRGHYSAFADRCYPAHITPLLQIDLERAMNEAGFIESSIRWTDHGRIPGLNFHWQDLFGKALKGKRFSDNIVICAVKPQHASLGVK